MPSAHKPTKSRAKVEPWDGNVYGLTCIGSGVSGLVFELDQSRVVKISLGTERSNNDIETERKIYRRFRAMEHKIGSRYIMRCIEAENPRGLVLDRCKGTVRNVLRTQEVPQEKALMWALQAAEGLAIVHDCYVVQGDVGCHNMLLDSKDAVRIADFAGSSIDGSDISVNYEVRSRLPDVLVPSKESDVFALGSVLYELSTGHPPYENESYRKVQQLYRRGTFPADAEMIPDLGSIILNCWRQKYTEAQDVVEALSAIMSKKNPRQGEQKPLVVSYGANPASRTPQPVSLELVPKPSRKDKFSPTKYVHQSSKQSQRCRRRGTDVGKERAAQSRRHSPTAGSGWVNRFLSPLSNHVKLNHSKSYYY